MDDYPIPQRWPEYEDISDRDRKRLLDNAFYLLRTGLIDWRTGFGSIATQIELPEYKAWRFKNGIFTKRDMLYWPKPDPSTRVHFHPAPLV